MAESARNSKLLNDLETGFDALRSRSSRAGSGFAALATLGERSAFGDVPPINLDA